MSAGVAKTLFHIAKHREEGVTMSQVAQHCASIGLTCKKKSANYWVEFLVRHGLVEKQIMTLARKKENRMWLKRFFATRKSPTGFPRVFSMLHQRCLEVMRLVRETIGCHRLVLYDLFDLIEFETADVSEEYSLLGRRKAYIAFLNKLWLAGESPIQVTKCLVPTLSADQEEEEEEEDAARPVQENKETPRRIASGTPRIFLTAVLHDKPLDIDTAERSHLKQGHDRVAAFEEIREKLLHDRAPGIVMGEPLYEQILEIIRNGGPKGVCVADVAALLDADAKDMNRLIARLLKYNKSLRSYKDLGTVDTGTNRTTQMHIYLADTREGASSNKQDIKTKKDARLKLLMDLVKKHKLVKSSFLIKSVRTGEARNPKHKTTIDKNTVFRLMDESGLPQKSASDLQRCEAGYRAERLYWDPEQITPTEDDFREALLRAVPFTDKQNNSTLTAEATPEFERLETPIYRIPSWRDYTKLLKTQDQEGSSSAEGNENKTTPKLSFSITEDERAAAHEALRNAYPLRTMIKRLRLMHRRLWMISTSSGRDPDKVAEVRYALEEFWKLLPVAELLCVAFIRQRNKMPAKLLRHLKTAADSGQTVKDLSKQLHPVLAPSNNLSLLVELLVSLGCAEWSLDSDTFKLTDSGRCPRKNNVTCDSDPAKNEIYTFRSVDDIDKFYDALKEFAYYFYSTCRPVRTSKSYRWLDPSKWGLRAQDVALLKKAVPKDRTSVTHVLKNRAVTVLMEQVDAPPNSSSATKSYAPKVTTHMDLFTDGEAEREVVAEEEEEEEDEEDDAELDAGDDDARDDDEDTGEDDGEDGGFHPDGQIPLADNISSSSSRPSKLEALFEGTLDLVEFKERFGAEVYKSLKCVLDIDNRALETRHINGGEAKETNNKYAEEVVVHDWVLKQRCFRVLQCSLDELNTNHVRSFMKPFKDREVRRCLRELVNANEMSSVLLSKHDVYTVLLQGSLHSGMLYALDQWDKRMHVFFPSQLQVDKTGTTVIEQDTSTEDMEDSSAFSLITRILAGSLHVEAVMEDKPIDEQSMSDKSRRAPKQAVHSLNYFDHISKLKASVREVVRTDEVETPSKKLGKKRKGPQLRSSMRKRSKGESLPRTAKSTGQSDISPTVNRLRKKVLASVLRRGAVGVRLDGIVESARHQQALDCLMQEEKIIKVPCDDHYRVVCTEFQENWEPNWKWLNPDGSVGWQLKSKMLRAVFAKVFFNPFLQPKALQRTFRRSIAKVELDVVLEELEKKYKLLRRHEDGSFITVAENLYNVHLLQQGNDPPKED